MRRQIRDIELDKKSRHEIRKRIHKAKDRRTADRLRVILYKAEGHTHEQIAHLLQMGINQVTNILNQYVDDGLESVLSKKSTEAPRPD